jgi:3,4-dihydroxy 2-butanone 4-phosphate synthase/GTP cyclohydrolase II
MLRFNDLVKYAAQHHLKMISIEALATYRRQQKMEESTMTI